MSFTIREARESDFQQFIFLFKEFAEFERKPTVMVNTLERMNIEKEYFNAFLVENEVGEIIGYATWNFVYYTWCGKSIYMDDLYVKPDYRGLGLGRKLIHKVFDFARETNCQKVKWQVSQWNQDAKVFYKSLDAKLIENEDSCELIL